MIDFSDLSPLLNISSVTADSYLVVPGPPSGLGSEQGAPQPFAGKSASRQASKQGIRGCRIRAQEEGRAGSSLWETAGDSGLRNDHSTYGRKERILSERVHFVLSNNPDI